MTRRINPRRIQCQRKRCRSHVSWIVVGPEQYLGKKPDEYDVFQEPIGFCTSAHMAKYFAEEYMFAACRDIKPKRFKRK